MSLLGTTLLLLFGYLCGSVPSGVLVARRRGIDIQRVGSGNIGATNVARTAGASAASLTLGFDILKGFLPTLVTSMLTANPRLAAMVGTAAFLGHLYSIFLRFSGGKGVATGFGAFLALAPAAAALALLVFAVVAMATRYASLASILAALTLPVACASLGDPPMTWFAAVLVAALIVVRHRGNIRRLWQGEEPKFNVKRD